MSKKIDLQLVMSVLSLIQNKEKWNLNDLAQKFNIDNKDLFYILSVVTDIYSQHGELLIDYEYDDKNEELLFNINPSLKNIIQINDGELFNLIFLLSSNSIYKELVKNNIDVEKFYNTVSPYFNLEILEENNDGIILEAINLNDDKLKTFLVNRIVDSLSYEDFRESKKSNNIDIVMKFTYTNKKVLTNLNKDDYQLKNKYVEAKFYSESNALNFVIKNYEYIEIVSPQSLINEFTNRKDKIIKKLKI